jgi:hypothetical protein
METITEFSIDRDIKVVCVTASSFPEGVQAAHQKLHAALPISKSRNFYGISYSDKSGNIVYKAAAEEMHPGEAAKLGLDTFVIRKGKYISQLLSNWRQDEMEVGKTFKKLLSDPRIDKNGYCLEIYLNKTDMRCLVPLDPFYSSETASSQQHVQR